MTLMMLNGQIKLVLLEFPDASSTFTYLEPCEVIPEISTQALKKKTLLKIILISNHFLICSQLMRDAFFFLFLFSIFECISINVYINACFLCCLYVTIGS